MFKYFLILLIVLLSEASKAQNFDLGKVTVDQLKVKRHPKDTSAVAAILFKKAKTTFKYDNFKGFVSTTEFEYKIKIYDKKGFSWANFKIPYDEIVEISKAVTHNLENGQILKDKVTSVGKIDEVKNEFWKTMLVVFPNVKEGSILELKYSIKSENLAVLPDFQYQYDIPVDYAEYTTKIPEFYLYKTMNTGKVKIESEQELENTSSILRLRYVIAHKQINSVYKASNIPSLVYEPYLNNINNYYSRIQNELQTIRLPEKSPKQVNTTWNDLAKYVYGEEEFGKELKKFAYFINDLKSLLAGELTDEAKMKTVFDFVKKRMHWNNKYGFYADLGLEKGYVEKVGNVADINLLLVSILRFSGLDANPVLLSTRENGFVDFPNRTKMNYVIASVNSNGEDFLLDATDSNSQINMLPIRSLNSTGRLIKEDGSNREVDLTSKVVSKESANLMATINAAGEIEGKIQKQKSNYNAFLFRSNEGKLAKESYIEKLEKELNNSIVEDYTIENKIESDSPVVETYSFKNNNSADIINDKIYFSPLLFFAITENPFKQEKREYPIDFIFLNQNKNIVIMNIPEGYVVESMPISGNVIFGDNLLTYKFNISNNGKQIQISSVFDIRASIISPESYEDLKMFYNEMIKKQNEKIVLKKI